jgi:hypothetical protein
MILKPLVLDHVMQIPRVLCKSTECSNGFGVSYFSRCVPHRAKLKNWLAKGFN